MTQENVSALAVPANQLSNDAHQGTRNNKAVACGHSQVARTGCPDKHGSKHCNVGNVSRVENLVWHYAPWCYLPSIVASGSLRTSNAAAPHENPLLWFSANQVWEPTATKLGFKATGEFVQLKFAQQAELFGCIRFGLSGVDSRLLQWRQACSTAGTPREKRKRLEKAGKRLGATQTHWMASVAAVSLPELVLQVWVGEWIDATSPQEMVEAWNEMQATPPTTSTVKAMRAIVHSRDLMRSPA